jgi:hypothetical protein
MFEVDAVGRETMFDVLSKVNWIAVLLASVALSGLGALWFMTLFNKSYAIALGRKDLNDHKPSPLYIVGPFLCGAVITITNAVLMRALNVTSYEHALRFGALVGLGYLASTTVNVAINPNIPKPLLYGLVSGGYFLVGSLLNSVILVAVS